ncbi:Cj0814 family flagellar-dependent secreted protein, partial [Campylobacter sp.]|uniref:Cj0814 family flagellar-dependent secreted protein n=1 Tax=Campylobacter sp. TaxID=205 RepID=UPI002A750FEA
SPATAVSQTTTTTAVAYGYSVDSKGFMGADFNKAAGLPDGFKIHKSTLDELNKVLQIQNKILSIDIKDNFLSNIDIADTIGQYFGIFSQIVAQKDSFSSDDLKNLPKGYMSDGEDMDYFLLLGSKKNEKVVSVFKDYNSLNEMRNISNAFYNVSSYISELDFSEKNLKTSFNADKSKFNPDMKYYENNDGTYSYESLFIGFLKSSEIMPLRGGNTKVSANAIEYRKFAYQKENNSKNPSIADILNGNVNLQELIKAQIQSNIWLRDNNKIDYQMMQNLKLQGLWFDENTDVAALEKNISSKINGLAPKIYS